MKNYYTKEEFMRAVGINNRSRLHQILRGYTTRGKFIPPKLEEEVDFVKTEYIFFESALKKLKKEKQNERKRRRSAHCMD